MKRFTAMLSAAAVVMLTAGVLAQAKPDFSGKWAMDAPADGAAAPGGGRGGGRGGFGMACTITQNATTLTIEYTQGQNPVKLEYKLDGSESKNMMMARGQQMEQVSKASWDGSTVKIVTTTQFGETTRVLSMEGAKLAVSSTNPGRNGGEPTTTKTTYSKG